jgi:hypothetical protein
MAPPTSRLNGRTVVLVLAVLIATTIAVMYRIRATNRDERARAARLTLPPLEAKFLLECGRPEQAMTEVLPPRATCPTGSRLFVRRLVADPEVAAITWALATADATRGGEVPASGERFALDLPATPGEAYLILTLLARPSPKDPDPLTNIKALPPGASVRTRGSALRGWGGQLQTQGVHARVVTYEIDLE